MFSTIELIYHVVNPGFTSAQMCTCEDTLAQYLGTLYLDDVMSHNNIFSASV